MPATSAPIPAYFVVMIDHGRRGREAIVDPEFTRRDVVGMVASGEYRRDDILFIQYVAGCTVSDVTAQIMDEVEPQIAEAA